MSCQSNQNCSLSVVSYHASKKLKNKSKVYPKSRKEYEKLMSHDSHKRVGGSVRQQRWSER